MIKFFILAIFFHNSCGAYEWFQLTEKGLLKRSIQVAASDPKKDESKFQNVTFSESLADANQLKQFPHLKNPQKIVLIGDTGCRLKDNKSGTGGEYQDCSDPNAWPFEKILESVAGEKADLLIHLGDYHYREQCTHGKECEKYSKVTGYSWQPWDLDYFKPMDKIGVSTPLILTRGNHEDCQRAYLGYRLFLKNGDWNEECKEVEDSQILEFGNIAIVNIDTSAMNDRPVFSSDEEKKWIERFDDINKRLDLKKIKTVWIITHKPAYGVAPFLKAYAPTNINFRRYLEKSSLVKKVSYIFSGHVHTSMMIKNENFPNQVILGNSGTKLEVIDSVLSPEFLKLFGYKSAEFINTAFGYAVLNQMENHQWKIDYKTADGKTVKSFDL